MLPPIAYGNKQEEPQPNIIQSERPWNIQPLIGCLHQISPLKTKITPQKRWWKSVRARWDGRPRKQGPVYQHYQSSCDLTETDEACTGLHQVLCVCIMASNFLFLWDSWVWFLILVGSLFLLLVCLVHFWWDVFHFILYFVYFVVSSQKPALSNKRWKWSGSGGRRRTGRRRGRGTKLTIHNAREESIFNKRKRQCCRS